MADNEEEREEDNEGGGRLERTCVMAILQVQPYCKSRLLQQIRAFSLRGQANISSSMSLSPGRHAHSTRFPAPSSSH